MGTDSWRTYPKVREHPPHHLLSNTPSGALPETEPHLEPEHAPLVPALNGEAFGGGGPIGEGELDEALCGGVVGAALEPVVEVELEGEALLVCELESGSLAQGA